MTRIETFGELDPGSLEQLERCAAAGDVLAAVLCADHHLGYSQPIGGVIADRTYVSPSGVGYDIACGNKAVKTNVAAGDVDVPAVMDAISEQLSFGMGRKNAEPVDHPVIEEIATSAFTPQRQLVQLAAAQLGTIGTGNHYVDLFTDPAGWLWVGVHFGSRGFGYKTANGFLSLARGLRFEDKAPETTFDSPPVLIALDSDLGQAYIEAMILAGEYAYAGRDWVCEKVLRIIGADEVDAVHNHHNFAWWEEHDGEKVIVMRKGATPIWPGQRSFIGGSMGDISVIVQGVEGAEAKRALYSTVHGAGRAMSRRKAIGKTKTRTLYSCPVRDCDFTVAGKDYIQGAICLDHGRALRRWRRTDQISPGLIDFPAVQAELRERGIELRGGAADEAPAAYKNLSTVLGYHADSIRVETILEPVGVAMAQADTLDRYKD